MGNVEFTDNRIKVEAALDDAVIAFAISTLYPVAISIPVDAPPPPAKLSTISSPFITRRPPPGSQTTSVNQPHSPLPVNIQHHL